MINKKIIGLKIEVKGVADSFINVREVDALKQETQLVVKSYIALRLGKFKKKWSLGQYTKQL